LIGESLSTDSGPISSGGDSTDFTHGDVSATTVLTTPGPGEYGAPCQLVDVADPVQTKAVTLQPDCAGGICVFNFEDAPPPCNDDSDCAAPWPTCGDGFCVLDQGFVAENTRCTRSC